MRWVTKNDVADLTGSSWRTVKKRLDAAGLTPNEDDCYPSDEALRAFFGIGQEEGDGPQLTAEKARLAAAQAEKYELDNAQRRGELLPRGEVGQIWSSHVTATRARLLAVPPALAPILSITMEPGECQDILESAIHEALTDLASSQGGGEAVRAAAEDGAVGLGGSEPEAVARGKRGAGAVAH
jgi:hypothetical protein